MTTLLLVGCGKMGGALLSRWMQTRAAGMERFIAVDPAQSKIQGANLFNDLAAVPNDIRPAVIVFAVKPQQMSGIAPAYAKRFGNAPLYLSIAAGTSLASLSGWLGSAAAVRAMPNTPALIGEGITALCAAAQVSPAQKETAAGLMQAAGKTVWVEDEDMMDAVTAVSGSGPAYVFLFMEALLNAAVRCGLPKPMATELVRQTVKGSALLAEKEHFDALRKQVTSPGGTTEAALKVFANHRLEAQLCEAVQAAMLRARELKK